MVTVIHVHCRYSNNRVELFFAGLPGGNAPVRGDGIHGWRAADRRGHGDCDEGRVADPHSFHPDLDPAF